ncbi:MAG: hypothetical protein Q8942_20855, partial [Bacillota bacterium]|nr:hypothetical protein [Bacillota bacterium]
MGSNDTNSQSYPGGYVEIFGDKGTSLESPKNNVEFSVSNTPSECVEATSDKADIVLNSALQYDQRTLLIPYTFENKSDTPLRDNILFTLDGKEETRALTIPPKSNISGYIFFDGVEPGNHVLKYESKAGSSSLNISIPEDYSAAIKEITNENINVSSDEIIINVSLENTGGKDFSGTLALKNSFYEDRKDISIKRGESIEIQMKIPLNDTVKPGKYDTQFILSGNGGVNVVSSIQVSAPERPVVVTPDLPKVEITGFNADQLYNAGNLSYLKALVKNHEQTQTRVTAVMSFGDISDYEEEFTLEPGQDKEISIPIDIPADLESNNYSGVL